ncbi:MAG: metallophosphoesterase family protein [Dehalococcoidia bacterium]|nr:metallophosphoesterase family protein [Dehalococcoidia bacterium]
MVKLAVLTDTHVGSVRELPGAMLKALADADLIVHTGDFTEMAVLEGLRSLKDVRAVRGNMDSREIQMALPRKEIFGVAGKKIGLIHGWGTPLGIAGRVRDEFHDVDVIIFGHSHTSCRERIRGALMFNPGRCRESYGLLTISEDMSAEVVRL